MMIAEYFDQERLLGRFETMSGEHGFVRWGVTTISPEVPGLASGVSRRDPAEVVFVSAADAPVAALILYGAGREQSIADVFTARDIPFRYPHGTVAPVHRLVPTVRPVERDGAVRPTAA
jgi:hypothetical protein